MLLTIVCLVLALAYLGLMLVYKAGWAKQNDFVFSPDIKPTTFVSVIIPARNEAGNIRVCINSILAQEYPQHLLEIIVVDDHSTDGTAAIVEEYSGMNVRCIRLADPR